LSAVVLSPTQSGTTGPSPALLVTTGSCQHTGPTHTMTTRHGLWHSGLTDDGPRLCGPTEESYLSMGMAALSPNCSDTTESSTTEESHLPVGTAASSPTRSNTTESTTSRRLHQQNSPQLNGPRHIDQTPWPISSRLGLSPPQMADVSNGPGPNDPATIHATALALLD
jgi:hypothetical protein